MPKPKKLTQSEVATLMQRLEAGETQAMLAQELKLDRHTIAQAVRAAGYVRPRTRLSDDQRRVVAARYAAGEPCTALASAFGVSPPTILEAVRKCGGSIRKVGLLTPEQEAEMVAMWRSGASVNQLINHFGIHGNNVRRRLRAAGIEPETRYDRPKKLPSEVEQEITRLYGEGVLPKDLEQKFGIARTTVTEIVKRNGGRIRPKGGRWREWSESDIADIARRWHAGDSQEDIAKSYSTHQSQISRLLRENGIEPLTPKARAPRARTFKGYRTVTNRGYISFLIPADHPFASMRMSNGYVAEHRLVMAQKLGRPLHSWEHVHHIDGNKQHNDETNLQLIQRHHGQGVRYRCRCCGSTDVEAIEFDVG